ncbi:MAG: DUF5916 domain-containing protein [Proteobacteria bacterium]|nr:DUF5916 domain-containing protein [Pseudomonadota bacterium]
MAGFDLTASIGQFGDTEHWRFGTGFEARSPGLELNDMGFQTSSDRIMQFLWMEHHDNEPGAQVLNWQANHDVFYVSDFSPRLLGLGYECNASAQLVNYWTVGGGCHILIDRWDPNALRGGPSLRTTNRYNGFLNLTSDQRKRVWASLSANLDHTPTGHAMSGGVDAGVTIQARSNLEIFVGPSWSSRRDALQYVDEVQDTTGAPHYLFGTIDQTTAALTLRVNWTFSPHLALQAYAQPFIASGLYSELKDVDHPGAARFEDRFHTFMGDEARAQGGVISVDRDGDGAVDFAFGKPDFDVRELRSTIVLRWEYRPGSNVYAIWSHGQSSAIDDGRFQLGRDLRGLSEAASENIVMVKANYWIGL